MKKRFLGFISLLYMLIILYVCLFDKLKNYLAPQMQIYLKLSIMPLFIMSLMLLLNKKINYHFKFSDIILVLPLFLLIMSGDGRLTTTLASNKTVRLKSMQKMKDIKKSKKVIKQKEEKTKQSETSVEKEEPITELSENYDFSNVYFDVKDASYDGLSSYITFAPKADKYENQTIRVRGFTVTKADYLPDGFFAIGKYAISCCAADANFTGFISKYENGDIKDNTWYEIEGILKKGKDSKGYDIMYIEVINIKEIDSSTEEEYIYPCYSYDDGSCEEFSKYNLEY